MEPVVMAWMTFPDEDVARQIGTALVERQCAACVHLFPAGRSIYRWQGNIEDEAEVTALAKTMRSKVPALKASLEELHPYDCPELLVTNVEDGLEAYLRWVGEMTEMADLRSQIFQNKRTLG